MITDSLRALGLASMAAFPLHFRRAFDNGATVMCNVRYERDCIAEVSLFWFTENGLQNEKKRYAHEPEAIEAIRKFCEKHST